MFTAKVTADEVRAEMSEMPVSVAMSTTMSDAFTEYSIQRKTFRPACT
jgi:hypothetical protein